MQSQTSTRAAKEFLIRCIVEEAQQEGSPLTDIERDMLYFSETGWTLPNMREINDAFDREYDQSAYETKISNLIRNFKARSAKEDSVALETWSNSVHALECEDHYILVMIRIAAQKNGPTRAVQLLAVGILGGIAALVITFAILFIARK